MLLASYDTLPSMDTPTLSTREPTERLAHHAQHRAPTAWPPARVWALASATFLAGAAVGIDLTCYIFMHLPK